MSMDIIEFKRQMLVIQNEAEQKKKDLIVKYCKENARYKVGEIIEDVSGKKILITKVRSTFNFGEPEPCYDGLLLKKNLEPTRRQETHRIYESRIKQTT